MQSVVATRTMAPCPLAGRIPKAKSTGNLSKDYEAQQERTAYIDVINGLWWYPSLRQTTWQYLQDKISQHVEAQNSVGTNMFDCATHLSKLEEAWLVAFIVQSSQFKTEELGSLKNADSDAIKQLAIYLLNCQWTLKLPNECKGKEICYFILAVRVQACGDRLRNISVEGNLTEQGLLHWGNIGVFGFKFKDGLATHIVHRPTKKEVPIPTEVHITSSFEINYNWSDSNALASKGAAKFKLIDFFEGDLKGLECKFLIGKSGTEELAKLVVSAQAKHQERLNMQSISKLEEQVEIYELPSKQNKQRATKRARDALIERKAENAAKRKFTVDRACIST